MNEIDIGDGQTAELGSKEHADAILRAVDGRNDMVHAAFQYQCRACHRVEWIYLGVGVEGPEKLREKMLYIASPFMGPNCLMCGGETSHVAMREDKYFEPIDAQTGYRYYRFPRAGVDMKYFQSSCYCGELAGNSGTTARRSPERF